MTKKLALLGTIALLAFFPAVAQAQDPLSIATMEPGSGTYATALTIAKVVAETGGIDIRPRTFKGSTQGIPFVDNGEVNFGLESARGLVQAYTGTGTFEGNPPFANLRLVGGIYPYHVGFIVRADSPIKTLADVRGKKMVTGYRASPNITALAAALLATGGLTLDDVEGLDVQTAIEARDQFVSGNVEVGLGGVDSSSMVQLAQEVGEIRYIPLDLSSENMAAAREFLPNARVMIVDPAPGRPGITEPTAVLEYDFLLYTNATTADDVIVKLIDGMIAEREAMVAMNPPFIWFKPELMAAQIGVPFHPAAEAHYKELGLWPTQ